MKKQIIYILTMVAFLSFGCDLADEVEDDTETSTDSDSDTDTDSDTDSDTDTDPTTGTIWGYAILYGEPVDGANLKLEEDSTGTVLETATSGDSETGYYEFVVDPGTYAIEGGITVDSCVYEGFETSIVVEAGDSVQVDIGLYGMDYAPYIYLYPQETTQIDVLLDPADGTQIVSSLPEYGDGWSVTATPTGLIDDQFSFLYYEATVLPVFQQDEGFAVESDDFMTWSADNLPIFGLNEGETGDFLEYWSTNLPEANCYEIYPQYADTIDQTMGLEITPIPDSLFRLRFLIKLTDECENIPEPIVTPFKRTGFTAVEWGVTFTS